MRKKQNAVTKEKLHPERYMVSVMQYYIEFIRDIEEIDRIGNISMDVQREVQRISRQGKLTGYTC